MTRSKVKRHIVVVNDEAAILNLFRDLLEEEGYQVSLDKFERETEALLDSVKQLRPDLVVLDFIIGGELKGWQLLQAIKMDRSTREIPIVLCTGAVAQVTELTSHLNEMGVHVILKPFDIDHLLEIIDKVWAASGSHAVSLDATGADEPD